MSFNTYFCGLVEPTSLPFVEQDDRGLGLQGPVPEGGAGDLPLLRGQEVHVRQQLQGGGGVPQVRIHFSLQCSA